ncbi:MAG: 16S rRNA (guanine(527)-N(7))-methyltransferase RsmG [Coriobacteriia bacterium]|nr:16S rRNA (guanine(527)-N(7))-methyltransferase RsmG [Coriobacteriia bacterium]
MSEIDHETIIDRGLLSRRLLEINVVANDAQIECLAVHAEAVLERNKNLNLTRITEPTQVIRLHIADSATALEFIDASPPGGVADLGSGAGFPGVPVAILRDRPVTLVESVRKKASFLRELCEMLGLDMRVAGCRTEELTLEERERFAVVTARALCSLPSLVELAAPLLTINGVLVALKGSPTKEEIRSGEIAAKLCGFDPEEVARFVLPGGAEERTIFTYRLNRKPQVRLPRRPGMAQRHPLA